MSSKKYEIEIFILFIKCFLLLLVIGYVLPLLLQAIINNYMRNHYINGNSILVQNGKTDKTLLENYIEIFKCYFILRL